MFYSVTKIMGLGSYVHNSFKRGNNAARVYCMETPKGLIEWPFPSFCSLKI